MAHMLWIIADGQPDLNRHKISVPDEKGQFCYFRENRKCAPATRTKTAEMLNRIVTVSELGDCHNQMTVVIMLVQEPAAAAA